MKQVTTASALALLLTGGILFSCNKKPDVPACDVTVVNLSGTYKLSALQYKANATAAPVDYLAAMDDCEKDNTLTLKNDGTYHSDDAGTVCSPDESSNGTWQLSGHTLTSDGTLNGTVASYDCKTLVYYVDNAITTGDRLTFTMVKQ